MIGIEFVDDQNCPQRGERPTQASKHKNGADDRQTDFVADEHADRWQNNGYDVAHWKRELWVYRRSENDSDDLFATRKRSFAFARVH